MVKNPSTYSPSTFWSMKISTSHTDQRPPSFQSDLYRCDPEEPKVQLNFQSCRHINSPLLGQGDCSIISLGYVQWQFLLGVHLKLILLSSFSGKPKGMGKMSRTRWLVTTLRYFEYHEGTFAHKTTLHFKQKHWTLLSRLSS